MIQLQQLRNVKRSNWKPNHSDYSVPLSSPADDDKSRHCVRPVLAPLLPPVLPVPGIDSFNLLIIGIPHARVVRAVSVSDAITTGDSRASESGPAFQIRPFHLNVNGCASCSLCAMPRNFRFLAAFATAISSGVTGKQGDFTPFAAL